ncbi:LysM peptidoglycan-binding domain-containing protein [bacterium]|nr:MAG: LysM peptidoglycan-binding domain-containing protein [bacterium]
MKLTTMLTLLLAVLLIASVGAAQEEMTKDQWQQQINDYTAQRNDLSAKVKALTDEVNTMQTQSAKLDDDFKKCMDDLYALVGSNADEAAAFRSEIESAENTANELSKLSDADLMGRSGDVDALATTVKNLKANKLAIIPEFYDRLAKLEDQVKSLQNTIGGQVKMYTVGTWRRDRDCLWNISKKKDIYNNAWMWPKIWQGNRDQIKDPDVIHPGQKLKIPKAGEMTAEEKSAAKRYYRGHTAAAPASTSGTK